MNDAHWGRKKPRNAETASESPVPVVAQSDRTFNGGGILPANSMAKKRTKLDRSQRQANQLEKRADTRPEQTPKKRAPREDFSQAAVPETRE